MNIGRGLDLLFPGQRARVHRLGTMDRTGMLFLKEFRDLTGFHRRISIKNRHYRMAYRLQQRMGKSPVWLEVLSTEEGQEAIGVFAREIMRSCGSITRMGAAGATVGCRWWQLVYAILVSLPFPPVTLLDWKKGINRSRAYDEMVEQARFVVRHVERSRYSSLYRLLYRNEAVVCESKEQEQEQEQEQEPCLRPMSTLPQSPGRYYVCTHRNGTIGHYFVLEKHQGSWYILSSYGSEWVRVPFHIHPISEEEVKAFLEASSRDSGNPLVIRDFFLRYFLEGGLPQRYSENEPDRIRGRVIPLNVGIRRELEIVMREPFEVGYIEGMEETIRGWVKGMEGGRLTARELRLTARELRQRARELRQRAQQPRLTARERRAKQRRSMRRRTVRRRILRQ